MSVEVTKEEILRRFAQAFDLLAGLVDQFTPEQAIRPGVLGSWSLRDLLAHLIAHEQRAIAEVQAAQQGQSFLIDHEANDAFNAGAVFACQTLDFNSIRHAWESSYQTIINVITAIPESEFALTSITVQQLDDSIDGALANNTYAHYAEHYPDVMQWRRYLETDRTAQG